MGTSGTFQSVQPDCGWTVGKREKPNNDGVLDTYTLSKGGNGERGEKGCEEPHEAPGHTPASPIAGTVAASPAQAYEPLGPAPAGDQCTLCGRSGGVERIRYRGHVNAWHPACADRHLAALKDPLVKVPNPPPTHHRSRIPRRRGPLNPTTASPPCGTMSPA
jgi:hypothetical protein